MTLYDVYKNAIKLHHKTRIQRDTGNSVQVKPINSLMQERDRDRKRQRQTEREGVVGGERDRQTDRGRETDRDRDRGRQRQTPEFCCYFFFVFHTGNVTLVYMFVL